MYALTKRTIDEGDWVKMPWVAFRRAIRNGSIDAMTARRIFNKHFKRLGVICKRENCSLEKARTINAALEGEISAALLKAGRLTKGSAYDSVETLLKDLKS